MFAGRPDVQFRAYQKQRHRKTEPADRFRQAYQVRHQTGSLEAEEPAGPTATGLYIVDDQHGAQTLCRRGKRR